MPSSCMHQDEQGACIGDVHNKFKSSGLFWDNNNDLDFGIISERNPQFSTFDNRHWKHKEYCVDYTTGAS